MTSPEPGRALLAHIQRLTAMMEAMDAQREADEEWLLHVDAQANERIAECEARLAVLEEEWARQREEAARQQEEANRQREEDRQRLEALRTESAERLQAHRDRIQVLETQAAQRHETIRGILDGLLQAQADIARLDAAS